MNIQIYLWVQELCVNYTALPTVYWVFPIFHKDHFIHFFTMKYL